MGLKVHSLGRIPGEIDRGYFVYLLDYGWDEPLSRSLRANFDMMASLASRNNAIVIAGFDGEEFTNEVFSWHQVDGQPGDEILPAILITTCHPHDFAAQNEFPAPRRDLPGSSKKSRSKQATPLFNDRLVLIPLRDLCKTETDVTSLIEKIFRDIRDKKSLPDFEVYRQVARGERGALVDALILKPSVAGIGVDLKSIARFFGAGPWVGKS
jgi:hypothetical protein